MVVLAATCLCLGYAVRGNELASVYYSDAERGTECVDCAMRGAVLSVRMGVRQLYGILTLVFLILLIVTCFITVALTYFQ
eukprot:1948691-Rhodomonas_salina.1